MKIYNIFVFVATALVIAGSFLYVFFGQAAEPLQNTYVMEKYPSQAATSVSYKKALAAYEEKQRLAKETIIKEQKRKDSLTALYYQSKSYNYDNSYGNDDDDDDEGGYYSSGGSIRGRSGRRFRGGSRRGGK